MNNGYQKYNGCGADKEGGKIFNTFFYPELQSKHVRPLAYNSQLNKQIHEQTNKTMKLIAQRNNSYTVEIKSDDGEKVRLKYFRLGEGLIPDYDRFTLPYGCSPLRVDADARQLIKPMWRRFNK